MTINWTVSKEDRALAEHIAKRAVALYKSHGTDADFLSIHMDIVACHANGCPLRLAEFLAADDFNFAHDVSGISRHVDRTTGKLADFFLPRFA